MTANPEWGIMSNRGRAAWALANSLKVTNWKAMDILAKEFGFVDYSQFANWHDKNPQITLEQVRGDNALFMLKALIAKYDLRQP